MIRVTKMSGSYYGLVMSDDLEMEMEEIVELLNQGIPSIIVEDISDLQDYFDIYDDVKVVERD